MKIYEMINEDNNTVVGILLYYEKEKNFLIELDDALDEWSLPFLFSPPHFAAALRRLSII